MTGQNYIHKMTAVFITLLMICSCIGSTNVFAAVKPIFEINSNVFNKSAISAEEIYLGESIKLTGKAALLDTKKCKYSYLSKYENQSWTTMQDFTSSSSYTWKPKSVGKYRICIKVLSPSNAVYKKMFNLEVKPKLENQSIISASHIKEDDINEASIDFFMYTSNSCRTKSQLIGRSFKLLNYFITDMVPNETNIEMLEKIINFIIPKNRHQRNICCMLRHLFLHHINGAVNWEMKILYQYQNRLRWKNMILLMRQPFLCTGSKP